MAAEQLDLNLLRVFDALLESSSVSKAADRLHLSVPATSRALGRLRLAMNDAILVRAGRGMVPTPFAQRAASRVKALLDDADRLRLETAGDPSTWRRTFAPRINDALSPVLAPRLTRLVARQAPHVQLRFVAQESKEADLLRTAHWISTSAWATPRRLTWSPRSCSQTYSLPSSQHLPTWEGNRL